MNTLPWIVPCLCFALALQNEGNAPTAGASAPLGPNDVKHRRLSEIDKKLRNSLHAYYGQRWIPHLQAERRKIPPGAPLDAFWDLDVTLADWLLREGQVEEAIVVLRRLGQAHKVSADPGFGRLVPLAKQLAIAHFRLAEQDNCVCKQSGDSCVFPLRGAAEHSERRGAEEAARLLMEVLNSDPTDLQSVWLLNLAHMALGSYPEGVPALYRIPPERIASDADIGRFEDIAPRLGVNRRTCAGGAIMDDFDGDGDLDLITSSMEPSTPMAYYRNQGNGTFVDVSVETGMSSQLGGLNFVQGDVDGDGRLDLYVPRGAWLDRAGEIPHSLLLQQPDGSFLDATTTSGLDLAAPSQVAAFADVDNDGDLDLFVGCESRRTRTKWLYPSRLYRNVGQARFEDVTQKAGVENLGFCKGASFGDFDGDGFEDLYVSNGFGPNRLYHNQGDGTFLDLAEELGVAEPIESFATWWFDANNDGWLDLLVTNYAGRNRGGEIAAHYKNRTTGTDSARIYLNLGNMKFKDASVEMDLNRPFFPMGANFGDYDNDGFPDLYFGTGDPDFGSLWPNIALRNASGGRFQDITSSSGLGHLQKGHGVAFGDVDNDGDQDLLVQIGGAFRDDAFYDALYHNPGHGHHWLTVRLQGVKSNRYAVGARIRVRIEEENGPRNIYSWVSSGGSFGGNSLQAEIGLGDAQRIVELEIRWPGNGASERIDDVPLDRTIEITEGEGTFTVVDRPAIKL